MNLAYAELPPEENSLSRTKDIYLEWIKKFKVDFPKNEEEHIEFRLEGWKILSGDKVPFEEELYRKIHKEFLQRVKRPESMVNHIEVCRVSEEIVRNIPAMVQVPTLVLHGTEDPIVPPDHGQALAALIKNSKYVLVEGMGHVPNKYFYQLIIDNVSNFKKNHLDSTHFK
jgi:pimeloyl-ACP methyl ester carboxylesterase